MLLVDGRGTPIGLHVESASPAEVKLLEATLDSLDIPGKQVAPERLIADRGYDSNSARQMIEGACFPSSLPEEIIGRRRIRTDDTLDVTAIAGLLNAPMPGCKIFAGSLFATNVLL